MDINQKFIDDVIISLMEMNDRLIALEEMAAEHVAEHEILEAKTTRIENEHDQAIDSLAHKIGVVGVTAEAQNKPAPEVTEKRKIFCDGMAFVFENMKDRDDAINIFNLFVKMNAGEIA